MNIKRVQSTLIILPVLAIALLLFSALVYLAFKGNYIADGIRLDVIEQIEANYNIKLTIEEATLVGTSSIVFKNVMFDLQPGSPIVDGIKILNVPELTVYFNVFDVLKSRQNLLKSLDSITVQNPHVVFRMDVAGISNMSIAESGVSVDMVDYPFVPPPIDLFAQKPDIAEAAVKDDEVREGSYAVEQSRTGMTVPSDFSIRVHIIDGTSEWLANTPDGMARVEMFEDVNGTIDVLANMPLDIRLEAKAEDAEGASMRAFGLFTMSTQEISDMQVDFKDLPISYVQAKGLNFKPYIWFTDGLMDGTVNMNGRFGQYPNFRGSATLHDGTGEYALFDGVFQNVNADMDFATRSANIKNLTATFEGIPLTLSGRISDFYNPYFDISVVSETRGLKYLKPLTESFDGQLPLEGMGEITQHLPIYVADRVKKTDKFKGCYINNA
jgi:hypothetical protein